MNKNASYICVMRHCDREISINNLCAICAMELAADRSARAIMVGADGTRTMRADDAAARIARNRANSKRIREEQQQAAAIAATLKGSTIAYGADAVHSAIVAKLVAGADVHDAIVAGRNDARGQLSHTITAARRRAGREMKYANHHAKSDPTADAALSDGADRVLLQADTFARPTVGRRGMAVDHAALAAATGRTIEETKLLVAAALDSARPSGDITRRARAAGQSVAALAAASANYSPDNIGPATMVAINKRARVLAPVAGTGRIK